MLLGISSFGTGLGPAATIALAQQVEKAGFHRFMLVERVHTNDSVAQCAAIGAATGHELFPSHRGRTIATITGNDFNTGFVNKLHVRLAWRHTAW